MEVFSSLDSYLSFSLLLFVLFLSLHHYHHHQRERERERERVHYPFLRKNPILWNEQLFKICSFEMMMEREEKARKKEEEEKRRERERERVKTHSKLLSLVEVLDKSEKGEEIFTLSPSSSLPPSSSLSLLSPSPFMSNMSTFSLIHLSRNFEEGERGRHFLSLSLLPLLRENVKKSRNVYFCVNECTVSLLLF